MTERGTTSAISATGAATRRSGGAFGAVTALFLLLAATLEGLLAGYWAGILEPRLGREAASQARILAESQGHVLATAIRDAAREGGAPRVVDALDQLLLIRDPESEIPFFDAVSLEVDYSVVAVPSGSLDILRGKPPREGGFSNDVAIFDARSGELLAVATFRVSDRFFRQLAADVKKQLLFQGAAIFAILTAVWIVVVVVQRKLATQTAERERAERALVTQLRKYQRLIDGLSNYFVYARDESGKVQFVGGSVARVLGWSADELQESFLELLTDDPVNEAARRPAPVIPGRTLVHEAAIRDRDGGVHRLELAEVPVVDEQGRVLGVEGIARDVTEQKSFELELQAAKQRAEDVSRTKSQFLANMSHEIRTPMNAVLGMTQLALKTALTPKQRDYLKRIQDSGQLLLRLIDDILDLSKIEAGRLELRSTDVDLDEVLSQLASVLGPRAADRGLELLFAMAPEVPRVVRGDPMRLQQVLVNLTNNAIKFTEEGEVVVRVDLRKRDDASCELAFTVKDSGIGIPREHVGTIFEPFTQVESSASRRFGGTGLGLAISRRIVELMGGELHVETTPGQGSTFTFTAHFELGGTAADAVPSLSHDELRGISVLVADDNMTARRVLKEMLLSFSFEVVTVPTGEEALEAVKARRDAGQDFGLAILDWKMPGMGGIEAARLLREIGDGPRIPTLIITAYGGDDVMRAAEEVADGFLTKPVSQSQLFNSILHALSVSFRSTVRLKTPEPDVPVELAGARVLLVEDNQINREVAQELLASSGVVVTAAADGEAALALLDAAPSRASFHAILMDVQMPGMDGVETTRRIRDRATWRDVPVIAMTAHAMAGDRERLIASGMDDYISKPVEERDLLAALGRWIGAATLPKPAPRPTAAGPEPPTITGIDVPDGLRRAVGNWSLFRRVVLVFARDNTDVVAELEKLLESGSREEALAVAHTLKGSAGTISARGLAAAAASLEQAVKGGGEWRDALRLVQAELALVIEGAASLASAASPDAAAAPATAAADPASRARVDALAAELAALLRSHNTRALACFEELRRGVGASAPRELLDAVERRITDLDFSAALAGLELLESSLRKGEPSRGGAVGSPSPPPEVGP